MRNRLIKLAKRGAVLCTALLVAWTGVVCFSFSVFVSATNSDAEKRVASMLQFFRSKEDLDLSKVSQAELRVFGVFLSNFYIPYETSIGKLAENSDFVAKVSAVMFGGSASDSQKETMKELIALVDKGTNESQTMVSEGSSGGGGANYTALLASVEGNTPLYANGKVIFNPTKDNPAYKIAFLASLAVKPSVTKKYIEKASTETLSIDCFGNIFSSSGLLLIPACLNPSAFSGPNSAKTRVNNAFMMGGLVTIDDGKMKAITSGNTVYYSALGDLDYKLSDFKKLSIYGVANKEYNQDVPSSSANTYRDAYVVIDLTWLKEDDIFGNNFFTWWEHDNASTVKLLAEDKIYVNPSAVKADIGLFGTMGGQQGASWNSSKQTTTPMYNLMGLTGVKGSYGNSKNVYETAFAQWNRDFSDGSTAYKNLFDVAKDPSGMAGVWDIGGDKSLGNEGNRLGNSGYYYNSGDGFLSDGLMHLGVGLKRDSNGYYDIAVGADGGAEYKGHGTDTYLTALATVYFSALGGVTTALSSGTQIDTDGLVIASNVNYWGGIYWAYLLEILGIVDFDETGKPITDGSDKPGGAVNPDLPEIPSSIGSGGTELAPELDFDDAFTGAGTDNQNEEAKQKEQLKSILDRTDKILSTESSEYRSSWFKAIFEDLILSNHNAMTGSSYSGSVNTVGSGTSLRSAMGYVTTQSTSEMPVVSWVLGNYVWLYGALLLLLLVFVGVLVVLRIKSLRQGVGLFLALCVLLVCPVVLIESGINVSNLATNQIFSDRFNFWAILQHQQRLSDLSDATPDILNQYALNTTFAVEDYYSNSGVTLKWQAPKKQNAFNILNSENFENEAVRTNSSIFKWMFSGFYNQQTYSTDVDATFLYRPYWDIVTTGRKAFTSAFSSGVDEGGNLVAVSFEDLYNTARAGFEGTGNPSWSRYSEFENLALDYTVLQESIYFEENISSALRGKYTSLGYISDVLTDPDINSAIFSNEVSNDILGVGLEDELLNSIVEAGGGGYEWLLYTESTYYYFYNMFKTSMVQTEAGDITGANNFAKMLLADEFFEISETDYSGTADLMLYDGALKDYLNLYGLFNFVIPHLQASNEYVIDWTNIYGTSVSSIPLETLKEEADLGNQNALEDYYKKYNMAGVWNMYTPWVDILVENTYEGDKIKVKGKTKSLSDPINPVSYEDLGRGMIFSPAESAIYGVPVTDLSSVELSLQKVLIDTRKDLYYLLNYTGYDNEVLLSMAAMLATFNFNAEFSKGITDKAEMYPAGFELKNMNFDAYLRLILLNSSGEGVLSTDAGIYKTFVTKSSIFSGIVLLLVDVTCIYLVPVVKYFCLVGLLLLVMVGVLSMLLSLEKGFLKNIVSRVISPLFLTFCCFVVHSWVIGLFVGEGVTDLVGSQHAKLNLQNSTGTLVLLLLFEVLYLVVLFLILKKTIRSLVTLTANVGVFAKGVAVALGAKMLGDRLSGKEDSSELGGGGSAEAGGVSSSRGGGGRNMAGYTEDTRASALDIDFTEPESDEPDMLAPDVNEGVREDYKEEAGAESEGKAKANSAPDDSGLGKPSVDSERRERALKIENSIKEDVDNGQSFTPERSSATVDSERSKTTEE